MTPAMRAALKPQRITMAGLVEIVFPAHTLRLCDGAGVVQAFGNVFAGSDPVFGVLGSIDAIGEEAGDTMPAMALELLPPSTAAAVQLAQPAMQGAPVKVWLAVQDGDTGAIVPDPELLFVGEIDTMALLVERGVRSVAIEVASVFDRLFEPDEGARLADSFHRWVRPGELGMANITGTPIEKLWGPGDKPSAAINVGGGSGGSGGGGGFSNVEREY